MKCKYLPFEDKPGVCDKCGKRLVGRQRRWCSPKCMREWQVQHHWGSARAGALKRDGYVCTVKDCTVRLSLEVNHIKPRNGKGYAFGCWNHQDGLESLCHAHHLVVTAKQRAARKARKR